MKRYIIIHDKSTSFYFFSSDKNMLESELKKIPSLRSFKLIWNIDRFTLKSPLSKVMKDKILDIFKEKQSKQIIRGHYGCLITGYGFGWK